MTNTEKTWLNKGRIEGLEAASGILLDVLATVKDTRKIKSIMAIPGAETRMATCEALLLGLGCKIVAEIILHTRASEQSFKDMCE